ncbi:NADPH:quinone oxidoreductase family protein [Amycolatopsis thermoflava]|uniref:NADPH:quinone oxidoreductase family protein n=1 Tax=Amycolatopsis thermoflava TaxID=84480 RepID=UPI0037FB8B04
MREVPDPVVTPGRVVVAVEAAAVNFPDVLTVADRYQVSLPVPFTPGSEFAGRVVAVGDGVTGFAPGDEVMGTTFHGAFAEQVVVPASALRPVPSGLTATEAAAFGVTFGTAHHALTTIGEMTPGDWVVVLGAAGGVGTAAVDIATRLGARVIAAAGSPERVAIGLELGAEAGIAYDRENLKERIREITGGRGADLVIDPVGGPYSEPALRAVRWGGRFVVVGFAAGEIPRIPLNLVLLKGVIVRGFEIRTIADHRPDAVARTAAGLDELTAAGMRPGSRPSCPCPRSPRR